MKREYSIPVVAYEPYSLTSHIAGACADAGKIPIGDVEPIIIEGTSVHCVDKDGIPKGCSDGAHTWTVGLSGTIFADGNKEGGCIHDVYNMEQYAQLIADSYTGALQFPAESAVMGSIFVLKEILMSIPVLLKPLITQSISSHNGTC